MGVLKNSQNGGDGSLLKKIIGIVKIIWNMIKNKPAKEISETDSVNDDSSLENIDKITQIFVHFKEQVHIQSAEIEQAICDEVSFYLDELRTLLLDSQEIVEKYGIKIGRIERKIDRILPQIEGIIDYEISKKVSLDNVQCKNIMKMIPGEKKERAMQEFLDETIKNALNICCKSIKEKLDEIFEEVNEEVVGMVEVLQNDSVIHLKQIETIDADNYTESMTKLMSEAYYIMDACNLVNELLQEA